MSISSKTLGKCDAVVYAMRELGLYGDVTKNVSIDPEGNIEPGCRVLIANKNNEDATKKLWDRIRNDCSLECAHVRFHVAKEGCIFDVMGPTRCPTAES